MPKLIDEYIGHVNSAASKVSNKKEPRVSVAHMRSPAGWQEPGQTPEFEEYTVVLRGRLKVSHKGGTFDVTAGQAVIAHAGEWIQYSLRMKPRNTSRFVCPHFLRRRSIGMMGRDDAP
jgi:ethanolamine utilization protein EutQ (cupin superfamily)